VPGLTVPITLLGRVDEVIEYRTIFAAIAQSRFCAGFRTPVATT
jgi:hypothetical protein